MKFLIASACLFILFSASHTFACQCWTNKKVSVEDLWKNDVIFKGHILSINGRGVQQALFRIDRLILSTTIHDTVSIYTPDTGVSCGLEFKQNAVWLIFASGSTIHEATQCSHSLEQLNGDSEKQIASTIQYLTALSSGDHVIRETIEDQDGQFEVLGEITNGKLNGKWIKVAGNDTLSILNFYYGKQIGYQFDRSRTGRIEEKTISYINGDKVESVKFYSSHGSDMLIAKYKNGILHGTYESKFSDTYKTGEFVNGKESGEWITYINGTLVSRKIYVNGKVME